MIVKKREANLLTQSLVKTSDRHSSFLGSYDNIISLLVSLAVILILLANCSPHASLQAPVANKPESRVFDFKPAIVMKAVEKVLINKKFTLKPEKSGLQHLQTEWLKDGSYRSRVHAKVNPIGKRRSELTVHLVLEKKKGWQKSWQPVDAIGKDVYDELMDDVLMESYRVLYDRR